MISLDDLLEASTGQLFGKPVAQLFEDFCLDADQATVGQLFVAGKAEWGDTHRHIARAIERGVAGVLCNQPPTCDTASTSVILVPDSTEALLAWARYILGKFGTKVIGITGAVGKSTAAAAIGHILQTKYSVLCDLHLHSAYGCLSVPLALARLNTQHDFAVLRLEATKIGDMAAMVEAVQPTVGLVTNIGILHHYPYRTIEHYTLDIRILIDSLTPSSLAVLNFDDDSVRVLANPARAQVRTIGIDTFGADMMVYNLSFAPEGTHFDLRYGSERFAGQQTPLLGQHHLYSVMAALSVGLHYGIPLEDSLKVLAEIKPLPGRMYPLSGRNGALLIDDTYNTTPQSALAALDWLVSARDRFRRVFFVFGDLRNGEAAGNRGYRAIGQRAAEVAEVLVTQGTDAAISARAALDYGMDSHQVHVTYIPKDTGNVLIDSYDLGDNDVILLKGAPSSRLEEVAEVLLDNPEDRERIARRPLPNWDSATWFTPTQLSWLEIDTEALAGNVRALKSLVGDDVALMAVVKSDGYGHGAATVARIALLNGASHLGVSSIQDATELRSAGIEAPILAMNLVPVAVAHLAVHQDITLVLYDLDIARGYDRVAHATGGQMRAHIKIDTGMGRLGVSPDEALRFLRYLMNLEHIDIEGICTHFSTADCDPDYTAEQLRIFKRLVHALAANTGHKFKYIHAANSAATLTNPATHFNMVRTGLALYGLHPSDTVQLPETFRPVLTWKTTIVQVKTLPSGHPVGYGNTYVTPNEEKIAVLPVGYADGFRRGPNNWGEVLVHGRRAPLIGRVSMEKTAINVSHIPDAAVGDEVVLLGRQGNEIITAEEIAKRLGTINYEVTCSILARVPRR